MRFSTTCLSLISFFASWDVVSAAPASTPGSELAKRDPNVPQPAGRLFKIKQKAQYFSGVNTWWAGYIYDDAEVDRVFSQLAKSGVKMTRLWGFGVTDNPASKQTVYFQTLNSSGGFINMNKKDGIPRLDKAVQAAEKYDIGLVIPLLNNWDDGLGGIDTYARVFGTDHNGFYTNPRAQKAYKDYIKFIVNRYKHSKAIFSWELCNEPRCRGCDTSVITNWARDISAWIRVNDVRHQVAVGDEGWLPTGSPNSGSSYAYSSYEGVDSAALLALPTIDYGTFHLYPDHWGYGYDFGDGWIRDHDAIGKATGKPVVLEEYGVNDWVDGRADILKGWQQTVLQTNIASDSIWQWGTQLSSIQPFDSYTVYYDPSNTSIYQQVVVQHAQDMAAKPAKVV